MLILAWKFFLLLPTNDTESTTFINTGKVKSYISLIILLATSRIGNCRTSCLILVYMSRLGSKEELDDKVHSACSTLSSRRINFYVW